LQVSLKPVNFTSDCLSMATTTTNPDRAVTTPSAGAGVSGVAVPAWPRAQSASAVSECTAHTPETSSAHNSAPDSKQPSQRDALQALLAFSALHDQVRRRKALAAQHNGFDAGAPSAPAAEFDPAEQFVLDEVLQLVAERAVAITGADGLAIALAENNEIVLRAAAGAVRPDVGARIDRDSAFSGACFRTAQIINCDDTETDPRVNLQACRKLGARSMVAVPLCGRRRVIGLLEAFSAWPFAFNDSDVRNLSLLAELVLGALKPEDEDRFAESAQAAVTKLEPEPRAAKAPVAAEPPKAVNVVPAAAPTVVAPAVVVPAAPAPVRVVPIAAVPIAPVPVVPVAEKKPVVPTVISAPANTIPAKPVVLDKTSLPDKTLQKRPDLDAAVATEATAAPELALLIPESASRRPVVPILLVFVVIVAAVSGGVWWKLKTAQLGSAMIHNGTMPTEKVPVRPAAAEAPRENALAPAVTAGANPAVGANASPDAASDTAEPNSIPATAQELAKFPRVTGIRHWSSADSSTVVLDLEDQVQYEAHRLAGPDRIYFDLRDTQLSPELIGTSIEVGDTFVSRIRVAQPVAGMTRIVLQTKSDSTFSVSLEPNPYRLVVEVRKIGSTAKAAVNLFPNAPEAEKSKLAFVIPPPTKEDLQLRARVPKLRIVVDAGHGGWDLGTVGRRGLLEKDLVLEIAQRLGQLLESRLGMEVIYTRQDDNYIPLDERASIANQAQADLFVSVHANYSDLPSARGVETYYANFFSAPGSKEAGPKEAASKELGAKILGASTTANGTKPSGMPVLSPADLHERIEQSRRLATSVQHSLYGTLSVQNPGLRDRGVKEAGFVVLTESAMPGILAEVSFVSSPTDEQKLRSDGYREEIAEALYKGIARYAATSKSVKLASAGK
jgi:N-acetylmuramoyl-L-alanine amidase/putative methionine-R-sulfoxide reductase with GAF domain